MNESIVLDINSNVDGNKDNVMVKTSMYRKVTMKIYAGFKIIFDRFLSLLGLLIASPIMIIIALLIKLDSKGPVLFRQERTGKNGKVFTLYKFRTMNVDNDVHNFDECDRHTRIGKILRKCSLDELPQLINVDCRQCYCGI